MVRTVMDCWPEEVAKESDSDRCVKEAGVQQLSATNADRVVCRFGALIY